MARPGSGRVVTRLVAIFVGVGIVAAAVFGYAVGVDVTAISIFVTLVAVGALAIAVARKSDTGKTVPARCDTCGGLISPNAPYCKHCGAIVG